MSDLELDARERAQIAHAQTYAGLYSDAGVPGHNQFLLIAKLATALGLGIGEIERAEPLPPTKVVWDADRFPGPNER